MNELKRTTNTEVLVRKLATKTNKSAAECLQEHSWNRPDEPQCGLPPAQLPQKKERVRLASHGEGCGPAHSRDRTPSTGHRLSTDLEKK